MTETRMTEADSSTASVESTVPATGTGLLLHRLTPMAGRNPHEENRVATTLELLYDLTLVVAFGVSGVQLAEALAAGHVLPGLAAFGFVQVSTVWAWMRYSWFASAFDNDDWGVRLCVAVQMVGILMLATGIPPLFKGFEDGWRLNGVTLVAGYVVMRVAMVFLWIRAGRANPERRAQCRANAAWTAAVQVLWIASCFVEFTFISLFLTFTTFFTLEFGVPVLFARRFEGTPFHAHHVAERFGLLTIISLGEVIVGTAESARALWAEHGWGHGAAVLLASGISITLALWWIYFSVPFGEILHRRRSVAYRFSYAHFLIFASVAAVGAGLHVAALREEGEAVISLMSSILFVVVPVGAYVVTLNVLVAVINPMPTAQRLHALILLLTLAVLGISVVLAWAGASFAMCLLVATFAPWVTVIGLETVGHRHLSEGLEAG